jgi:carbon storage regulator
MLVLSRKMGDSVVIDGSVRVRVIEIKGDSVRLGIDAPREIPVHRHEVFERLAAAGLAGGASLATV